ncbi:nitric-oxide reductase large subunit [Pontiella agarivorans]|uniref:Nitric-oxide reductase large subunit n=1 Tax=Pontiella agarivorans TaxID=3038953 RepID=A0ABU5MVQ3_9BACT|nr:nitric-oxide reductase large subunit [Pontiella agarivorans]MDZ8118252.1 nitric-oxide reductase large subunit [Pontiella agarivorans]
MSTKKHWIALTLCLTVAFSILGYFGIDIYKEAPPLPQRIVSASGEELFTLDDLQQGQLVWQSTGGQQMGSVWGHGAYQAPDWSADWLHRESIALLNIWSQREFGVDFEQAGVGEQAGLQARLEQEMRHNGYNAETGLLTISDDRTAAMRVVAAHYESLFSGEPELRDLREAYAMHEHAVKEKIHRKQLAGFFFWTSWACAAERPGLPISYTNNWPHEPLVGNTPTGANFMWSMISIISLLAAVGGLVWYEAFRRNAEYDELPAVPAIDPLKKLVITPSMKALWKYALVIFVLFGVQVMLGALTAHYTVEGQEFFGFPIAEFLPYAVSRTWHIQTAMFWIATAFLTAGLFLAPIIGGREPKFQRLGVNVLFFALLLVVAGSLAGEWLGVMQTMELKYNFWFGHQGYEYVDLGRFWQILLFSGLLLWLILVLRGLWPALKKKDDNRHMVAIFIFAATAIGLFYASGFFYGAKTHISVMEYWRWWVVHLWVEGFFEVFATIAIATIFCKLGLVKAGSASRAVLYSSCIFLIGGIPGTFHHLYFSGTPFSVVAIGAMFSALEVVPLLLIGLEARETSKHIESAEWMQRYKWPLTFFMGVAFWNFVGAGVFGFLINPPIALYYMQGLNTTPVHAHAALFGVYGLLSLGLVLLVIRCIQPDRVWNDRVLKLAYWGMNGGLALMIALSLLPIGIAQTVASVDVGLWYARSADFLQQGWVQNLRWLRMIGDVVFLGGVGFLLFFGAGLLRKPQTAGEKN